MPQLEYNDERHEYRLDGNIVPSVTEIIKPLSDFSRIPPDVLEFKRSLGKAVHKAIELWEMQDLNIDELDPEALPYFEAWLKFKEQTGFRAMFTEMQVWSVKWKVAGTLDILGSRDPKATTPDELIDAKCVWAMDPATAIQTAAYEALLLESQKIKIKKRGGLQLLNDGQPKYFPYDKRANKNDIYVFQSLLNIHNWRKNQ